MTATRAGRIRLPGTRRTVDLAAAVKVWDAALCAQVDPDLFFPEVGDEGQAKRARLICARCEVVDVCLATFGPVIGHGVVGGQTVRQRQQARRDRRAA